MPNDFDVYLEDALLEQIAPYALTVWKDICAKYDVEYIIKPGSTREGDWIAVPSDAYEARLKEFGSGIEGKQALFWFEKAKAEFYSTIKTKMNDTKIQAMADAVVAKRSGKK